MHLRFLIICVIGFCLSLQAQNEAVILRGKLINEQNGEAIPYAHIIITNKNVGLSSDLDGEFRLLTAFTDSLKITAIGFSNFNYIVSDTINLDRIIVMELIPIIYELATVEITPYLSYAELREAIVNYELSKEELKYLALKNNLKKILGYKESIGNHDLSLIGSFSYVYYRFSKSAKSHRKLRKIRIADHIHDVILSKYNPEVVSQLIGERDLEVVKEFINFCNLSDKYLLKVTILDLYMNLLIQYDTFLEN